jgi:hypothetical protein
MTRRSLLRTGATLLASSAANSAGEPFRIALAGLTYGRARGFFTRNRKLTDVRLVGMSEPDAQLRAPYFDDYKIDAKLGNSTDTLAVVQHRLWRLRIYGGAFPGVQATGAIHLRRKGTDPTPSR